METETAKPACLLRDFIGLPCLTGAFSLLPLEYSVYHDSACFRYVIVRNIQQSISSRFSGSPNCIGMVWLKRLKVCVLEKIINREIKNVECNKWDEREVSSSYHAEINYLCK